MGSLFQSPSVPQYTPVTVTPSPNNDAQETQQEKDNNNENNTNEDVRNVISRVSRGRNSTIQTSYRGVLNAQNYLTPQRKSLLGE